MKLESLVGAKVVSWGPEHDYYRMVLDRATLTLFNTITDTGGDLVGRTVSAVALVEGVEFRLDFDNGARMRMSLRDEDYFVYEAGIIGYEDGTIGSIG